MIFGNAIKCFMGADGESGRNRYLSCEIRGRQAGWDMPMLKAQHAFRKDLLTNDRRNLILAAWCRLQGYVLVGAGGYILYL